MMSKTFFFLAQHQSGARSLDNIRELTGMFLIVPFQIELQRN